MKKCCSACKYWKRDGVDGICFGGTPQPTIVKIEPGTKYTMIRPRTNPDDFCPTFSQAKEEIDFG